jgi:outer membrane receptor protein involved in Fe transport
MKSTIRLASALLAGSSLLALACGAHAQAAKGSGDQIVVTGSRVITNGNNSPTPVTVVTTQQMLEVQPSTIADALNDLPTFNGSQTQTTNPGNSSQNNAANLLNLRNVGATRVLILYDGHRVPPTSPTGGIDIDLIPQLLLQRVDVVTGGASAVYGSDAVSGVVNFITDTHFNGIKLNVQGGVSQYGDDHTNDEAVAFGKTFLDGKLHFEGSYEFHDDPGIFSKLNRPWGQEDWSLEGGGTAANPYHLVTNTRLSQSSFNGVITSGIGTSGTCTATSVNCNYLEFNQPGVLSPFVHGVATGSNNTESGGDGGYYSSSSLKSLLVSHQVFGRMDYDVTDHIHAYFEFAGTLSHNENNHQWVEVRGTNGGSPGVLGYNNAYLQGVTVPGTGQSLYNPACTGNGATAAPGCTFNFGRMVTQLGQFQPNTNETNYNLIGGLSGDFANGAYKWELGGLHTNSVQDTKNDDNLNQAKMLAAEDAVVVTAANVGASGFAIGSIQCHAALVNKNYANCVPINLFGPGSVTAAAAKYVTGVTEYWAHTHMDDVNGSLSGAPLTLPAGPVNMAVSGEWRKLTYSQISNALPTDTADCNGIEYNCTATTTEWASNTLADRTPVSQAVWEVAYEADVPIVKDVPFIQAMNLNGAVRYTNYSNSGGTDTWKVGLDWHVNDELTLRATHSRDIRAPNLNELYAPTVINPAGVTDVLIGNANLQRPQENESNPNLKPEEADTTTAGFVYKPHYIPRFSLSVDAYRITVNGYISTIAGNNTIIQGICNSSGGASPYCALIPRLHPITDTSTDNYLLATISTPLNIASLDTYGADIEANYAATIFDHPATARVLFSYQPHILYNNGPTGYVDMGDSVVGQSGALPTPSEKLTFIGSYTPVENFKVSVLEKWRDGLRWDGVSTTPANSTTPAINKPVFSSPSPPPIAYTDLTLTYTLRGTLGGNTDMFFNIQNLFNQQPYPASGAPNTVPGLFGGYLQGDDPVGRYFTIGLKYRH